MTTKTVSQNHMATVANGTASAYSVLALRVDQYADDDDDDDDAERNRLWVVVPSMLTGHQQEPMCQQQ